MKVKYFSFAPLTLDRPLPLKSTDVSSIEEKRKKIRSLCWNPLFIGISSIFSTTKWTQLWHNQLTAQAFRIEWNLRHQSDEQLFASSSNHVFRGSDILKVDSRSLTSFCYQYNLMTYNKHFILTGILSSLINYNGIRGKVGLSFFLSKPALLSDFLKVELFRPKLRWS